ncbi:MAG: hypothetical protein JO032_01585 [Alphaproteobacteria bacterium]|nr:hypothetical protein [Alphaproteobacteria bacterium]
MPELFVILAVVFAAWHLVKAFNRAATRPAPPRRPAAGAAPRAMIEAEDLVACRVCGTYIASSARACGRAGCPQPR